MNDPLFDIAAFLLEARLDNEKKLFFLQHYFKGTDISPVDLQIIGFYQFCQDVLWFVWTLVKEENNECFDDYGNKRLARASQFMHDYLGCHKVDK
ncbi:hypothetical protein A4G18_03690 [Pasteurellaceae bacterium Pebbles2]|nr:hypothetical protein [Pasteurellaceae bacterium Pebbles2]